MGQESYSESCSRGGVIEYIPLNPRHFDVLRGKGYNELLLINETIERSKTIREAGGFLKVTGRYPIYNIRHYIDKASDFIYRKGGAFYGDMKDHNLYKLLGLDWNSHSGYAVMYGTTVENYLNNIGCKFDTLNDSEGRLVEDMLFEYMKPFRGKRNTGVSCRFQLEPICGGLQGSSGDTLSFSKDNMSIKSKIMRLAGNCIRTFMPWFWF